MGDELLFTALILDYLSLRTSLLKWCAHWFAMTAFFMAMTSKTCKQQIIPLRWGFLGLVYAPGGERSRNDIRFISKNVLREDTFPKGKPTRIKAGERVWAYNQDERFRAEPDRNAKERMLWLYFA